GASKPVPGFEAVEREATEAHERVRQKLPIQRFERKERNIRWDTLLTGSASRLRVSLVVAPCRPPRRALWLPHFLRPVVAAARAEKTSQHRRMTLPACSF